MSTPENWRTIPILHGYEVSDLGRVRNAYTGHILKPFNGYGKDGRYYQKVHLYVNGKRFCQFVHRLVVFAFYEVDHRDRVKAHNALSNLEPVLHPDNIKRREEVPF